jgi:hypothetical protein
VRLRLRIAFGGLTLAAWLASATSAQACPCGCGAASPQVLYPGETWRFSAAGTHEAGIRAVTAGGDVTDDGGPTVKNTLTLAAARAIVPKWSATLTVPVVQNQRDGEDAQSALGDPSLSVRYAAYDQTFAEPALPSVAGFATYKRGLARSIYDTDDPHLMDVHGNGFDETMVGAEAFYGLEAWKLGLAEAAIVPLARRYQGPEGDAVEFRPGWGQRTTLTTGYQWVTVGQALVVLERETARALSIDGEDVPESEKVVNAVSTTLSYALAVRKTLALTAKRNAAFGDNRNTTRTTEVGLAYMQAL